MALVAPSSLGTQVGESVAGITLMSKQSREVGRTHGVEAGVSPPFLLGLLLSHAPYTLQEYLAHKKHPPP